jgi:hypothetical protein
MVTGRPSRGGSRSLSLSLGRRAPLDPCCIMAKIPGTMRPALTWSIEMFPPQYAAAMPRSEVNTPRYVSDTHIAGEATTRKRSTGKP